MRTRITRAAIAVLAGSLLLVPTAASAGPVCHLVVHDVVEEQVVDPIDNAAGTDLAHEVHEAEETACPFLP